MSTMLGNLKADRVALDQAIRDAAAAALAAAMRDALDTEGVTFDSLAVHFDREDDGDVPMAWAIVMSDGEEDEDAQDALMATFNDWKELREFAEAQLRADGAFDGSHLCGAEFDLLTPLGADDPCDERCGQHSSGCDGYCTHTPDHANRCLGAPGPEQAVDVALDTLRRELTVEMDEAVRAIVTAAIDLDSHGVRYVGARLTWAETMEDGVTPATPNVDLYLVDANGDRVDETAVHDPIDTFTDTDLDNGAGVFGRYENRLVRGGVYPHVVVLGDAADGVPPNDQTAAVEARLLDGSVDLGGLDSEAEFKQAVQRALGSQLQLGEVDYAWLWHLSPALAEPRTSAPDQQPKPVVHGGLVHHDPDRCVIDGCDADRCVPERTFRSDKARKAAITALTLLNPDLNRTQAADELRAALTAGNDTSAAGAIAHAYADGSHERAVHTAVVALADRLGVDRGVLAPANPVDGAAWNVGGYGAFLHLADGRTLTSGMVSKSEGEPDRDGWSKVAVFDADGRVSGSVATGLPVRCSDPLRIAKRLVKVAADL